MITEELLIEAACKLGAKRLVLNSFKGVGYVGWIKDQADYRKIYQEEEKQFLTILREYIKQK